MPSANSAAASSRPCSIGIGFSISNVLVPAEVIRGDQSAEQQHRGEFDGEQIRSVQRDADGFGAESIVKPSRGRAHRVGHNITTSSASRIAASTTGPIHTPPFSH